MKKFLVLLLTLTMVLPIVAVAEADVDLNVIAINREAVVEEFEGDWVLTGAYTAEDGVVEVLPDAVILEIKCQVEYGVLVDMEKYIHEDVTNLQGTMSFSMEDVDVDVDDYKCSASWDQFGKGASKFKVRDDDEGVFFDLVTGIEIDDMELMDVVAINTAGQLILGYSEDHIENDDEAVFEYAYIFTKAE